MSEIKKGALVKAWDDGGESFMVGSYVGKDSHGTHLLKFAAHSAEADNAIEIPADLAKQLEELGGVNSLINLKDEEMEEIRQKFQCDTLNLGSRQAIKNCAEGLLRKFIEKAVKHVVEEKLLEAKAS